MKFVFAFHLKHFC